MDCEFNLITAKDWKESRRNYHIQKGELRMTVKQAKEKLDVAQGRYCTDHLSVMLFMFPSTHTNVWMVLERGCLGLQESRQFRHTMVHAICISLGPYLTSFVTVNVHLCIAGRQDAAFDLLTSWKEHMSFLLETNTQGTPDTGYPEKPCDRTRFTIYLELLVKNQASCSLNHGMYIDGVSKIAHLLCCNEMRMGR